jgi:hypothetical protein
VIEILAVWRDEQAVEESRVLPMRNRKRARAAKK